MIEELSACCDSAESGAGWRLREGWQRRATSLPCHNGDGNISAIYPNQSVTFTATVGTPPEPVAVTWSLSGSACTGSPNPCGTIDSSTGVYQAPAAPPSPLGDNDHGDIADQQLANRQYDGQPGTGLGGGDAANGERWEKIWCSSSPPSLCQTMRRKLSPGRARQVRPAEASCQDPNNSGRGSLYRPASSQSGVQVAATSTVQQSPLGVGTSKVSVTSSRLAGGAHTHSIFRAMTRATIRSPWREA